MVPWQTGDPDQARPQLGSLDMNPSIKESGGPKRLLSSEKYNLIKERLAAGSGPSASSSRSVGGQTRSSSSGDQFQSMKDVVRPPPGHPFLKTRPTMKTSPRYDSPPPPSHPPPLQSNPPPLCSNLPPPSLLMQTSPMYSVPPPMHSSQPAFHPQPPPSHNAIAKPRASPTSSLLSGLMNTPSIPRVLSTAEILSLVLRLSSVRVPSEAKKSGLMQLLKIPSITESLVHQLLTMENGDLFSGLKCILTRYMENEAEDTAEVLEQTLSFLNKCLALQKPSPKLRSLIVGKSKELAVSSGGMSVLEQLVMVSKTRGRKTAMVDAVVCEEITQELQSVPPGRLLGTCHSAWDLQGEVATWVKMQLEMDFQTTSSAFVRSLEEKYRVVEVSLVMEDMTEASLHKPILSKYPDSFWPAVHTVRQDQASPCICLTVVQFLPTGHLLAYTDLDWQKGLTMLDQELQFSQSVLLQTGARDLQPGHMVMVSRVDVDTSTLPLHQFTLARAVILSLNQENTARLYLLDHGMKATIPTKLISSLPPSLKTLPPRLVLCRVQGITPTPSTRLVAQSIVTLSYLTNSATAISLVLRPTLSTAKVLCQLLSSQQGNLITPALDILHIIASTPASLKHLIISNRGIPCIAVELIIPTMSSMFYECLDSLSLRTVCTALETIHCLLVALQQPEQLRKVFSDEKLCSVLEKVEQVHTLGQYQGLMDKILDMNQGRRVKRSREQIITQETKPGVKITPSPVFKNTDIRERKPQPHQISTNPHRIVVTDRPVFASVEQLEQKHRRETVANIVNKGQVMPMVNREQEMPMVNRGQVMPLVNREQAISMVSRKQVMPMVDPDMERRRQEREKLTADAMKLFNQHKEKLDVKSGDGPTIGIDDGQSPSEDAVANTPTVTAVTTAIAAKPDNASLPSWLGGYGSTSASESEDDDSPGLPPWLARPAQPSSQAQSVSQMTKSMAKLPFASALESSSSSSQEDDDDTTQTIVPANPPASTHVPRARYSPEECGSGTESSMEVQTAMAKEQRAMEMRMKESEQMQMALETRIKEQEQERLQKAAKERVKEQERMELIKGENLREQERMKMVTDECAEDKLFKDQQQVLIRDYILSEKHSMGMELWDVERKSELDNNQLAVLICGFLNTKAGGTIYAGVKRNGLVRGIPLERKDRDTMRQMLDRVLASMINPRVPPNIVDIDFVTVEDKSRPSCPYRLMVIMVKGQKDGLDKVYMAHNLTSRATVEEGAYVRRGHGPGYNIRLGHEEMLRLVERR